MHSMSINRVSLLLATLMTSRWITYGFIEVALSVILRDAGVSLAKISMMLGVGVLFLFKFLWAPLVDRWDIWPGRRYLGWYAAMQALMTVGLVSLFWLRPEEDFWVIFGVLLVTSIAASFRDIAMDALAVEWVGEEHRAKANGWMSAGFMLGMLLGGGVMLMLYDRIGWPGAVICLVATTLATVPLAMLLQRRIAAGGRRAAAAPQKTPWASIFRDFFAVPGQRRWAAFLLLHAVSAVAGSSLLGVMLVDIKWSVAQIGFVLNVVGPALAVAVSLLSGWIFSRLHRGRALFGTMVVQALFNLALLPIAVRGYSDSVTSAVVVGTVLVTAVANLIIKTAVMDRSAQLGAMGTHFTLQGSITQLGGVCALVLAPLGAQYLGYQGVILFGLGAGLASALILLTLPRTAPAAPAVPVRQAQQA